MALPFQVSCSFPALQATVRIPFSDLPSKNLVVHSFPRFLLRPFATRRGNAPYDVADIVCNQQPAMFVYHHADRPAIGFARFAEKSRQNIDRTARRFAFAKRYENNFVAAARL